MNILKGFLILTLCAFPQISNARQNDMNTTRAQRADDTYKTLFQSGRAASPTDPELLEMLQRNIFGEAFHIGDLSMRERELITVAVLTTLQTLPQLKAHINAALNVGASPLEIRETIYNCAAFIGFPRVLNAVGVFNETAKERGIALPLQKAGATTDADRHAKGLEIQTALYGDEVKKAMADLPAEYKDVIPDTLTDFCFGDIYTRGGLSLKERELLSLVVLTAMGAQKQILAHVAGAMKAGNDKETLLAAMLQTVYYIGLPNALATIEQIKKADGTRFSPVYE